MFTVSLPLIHVATSHARFQLKCVVLTREFFRAAGRCSVANDFVLCGGQRQHRAAEGKGKSQLQKWDLALLLLFVHRESVHD